MRLFQTLVALVTGAIAALLWVERQTSSKPAPRPDPPAAPPRSSPTQPPTQPSPEPERVVEQVVVPDPEQSARIEALEAELEEQRAIRASEPDEPPPSIDAIRAARARSYELERQLTPSASDGSPGWSEITTPALDEMIDAAAEHLPLVALRTEFGRLDASALWTAIGAMQNFAEACEGDWFEFHGDFARWCLESGPSRRASGRPTRHRRRASDVCGRGTGQSLGTTGGADIRGGRGIAALLRGRCRRGDGSDARGRDCLTRFAGCPRSTEFHQQFVRAAFQFALPNHDDTPTVDL